MEKVAAAGESLLVVTDTIASELITTFIVNADKGTLRVSVVHPLPERSGAAGAKFGTPPSGSDQLLRLDDVWIRRSATVCFPTANDPAWPAATLQDFAIIETGGENHEDQFDRLRFLMRELQQTAG
jgi:hypothetical protein